MSAHPRSLLQSASNYFWPSDESRPLEWRYRGAGEDECGGLGFCTHCTCGSSPQRQQDWLWKACGGPHYLRPKLLLVHRAGAAWGLWPALSWPSEKYTRQSECRAETTIKEEAIILAFLLKPSYILFRIRISTYYGCFGMCVLPGCFFVCFFTIFISHSHITATDHLDVQTDLNLITFNFYI